MRVTRILPLLITCALIAGLFEFLMVGNPLRPPLWTEGINLRVLLITALGLSGFYGQFGSLAPSYTVSYELLYYAIWGCTLAVSRSPRSSLFLAFSFTGITYLIGVPYGSSLPSLLQPVFHPWVMLLGIGWVIGAAIFVFEHYTTPWLRHTSRLIPCGMFVLFLWGCSALKLAPSYGAVGGVAALYYLCLAGCFSFIIARTIATPSPERVSRFDTWLGEISYPLFLVHGPTMVFGSYLLAIFGVDISPTLRIFYLFSLSLLLAHALSSLVEKPVMKWRRGLRKTAIQSTLGENTAQ